jgi:hypothetical protein
VAVCDDVVRFGFLRTQSLKQLRGRHLAVSVAVTTRPVERSVRRRCDTGKPASKLTPEWAIDLPPGVSPFVLSRSKRPVNQKDLRRFTRGIWRSCSLGTTDVSHVICPLQTEYPAHLFSGRYCPFWGSWRTILRVARLSWQIGTQVPGFPQVGLEEIAINLLEARFWITSGLPTSRSQSARPGFRRNRASRSPVCNGCVKTTRASIGQKTGAFWCRWRWSRRRRHRLPC